jgi:hypothetical protein
MKRPLTCFAAVILLAVPTVSQKPSAWILVRSEADTLESFPWERLAKVYLRKDYHIVRAADAAAHPKASRLVVGTPADNALIKKLAKDLGIEFEGKHFRYDGQEYPDDAGLAVVTDDPDGAGTLVVFTGATPKGAYNCLSVPVDLNRHGYVAMTLRHALRRGRVRSIMPLAVDGDALRVVRLDLDLWRMRDSMAKSSLDEAALRVSRAFLGYKFLFEQAVSPDINLLDFTRAQFKEQAEALEATRKRFAEVDLEDLLEQADKRVVKALAARTGPRPVVYTIVTRPGITNAQVIGRDPDTGRMRMVLNLAAHESLARLRISAAHEFVHTLQGNTDGTLLARALHEGVAVYVAQQVQPGTKDHEALMWTEEKLAAANQRRKAILDAFRELKGSRDMREIGCFVYAGQPLRYVSGAPDRCGYYVGLLAVTAWRQKHKDRPLGDLLRVDPAEIFAALE